MKSPKLLIRHSFSSSTSMWNSEQSSCSRPYPLCCFPGVCAGSCFAVQGHPESIPASATAPSPTPSNRLMPGQRVLLTSQLPAFTRMGLPVTPPHKCFKEAIKSRTETLEFTDRAKRQSRYNQAQSSLCDLISTVPTLIQEGTESHLILSTRKLKGILSLASLCLGFHFS